MKDNLTVVTVVGKPNIGKSTLINRICVSKDAIVHEEPMITRDRKYYKAEWNGKNFYILDTGGIDFKPDNKLSLKILLQSKKAIDEADIIIFLVNLREPLSGLDQDISAMLRKIHKQIIFAGNKWDTEKGSYFTEDYLGLGLGYPVKISAMHGIGIGDLLDEVVQNLSFKSEENKEINEEDIADITILGKPNAGKSTLFNTLINEERVIVDEKEGTTRDTIDSILEFKDKKYRFIDTAGLKKDKVVEEDLEYYSKLRTVRAIKKSDVALVLVDSTNEISRQDINIVDTCLKSGTSVIVIFSKIDIASREEIENNIKQLEKKLSFAEYIPFLKVSAVTKKGIAGIFKYLELVLAERRKTVNENKLMAVFSKKDQSSFIYSDGKKYKLKFIRQAGSNPPYFIVFSNMDISKKTNIKNFIQKTLRENYDFTGTPIAFKYKY
ncbi:MAG: ribosome biogenesis GTPase Der [Actinobacteria bacterium]|nr:ribosome biogenesis GTPase Der [Actinomycetota bacterium]